MLARHRFACVGAGTLLLAVVATLALLGGSPQTARAVGPVVTSADDEDDGTCDFAHCSLREALLVVGPGETITFAIDGDGPHTVHVGSGSGASAGTKLPAVANDGVIIDGYTQSGASVNTSGAFQAGNAQLQIVLDGSQVNNGNAQGLWILGVGITIRGLVIQNFSGDAIHIGTAASAIIKGNYIGTDVTGTDAQPNGGAGTHFVSNMAGNQVGGTAAADRNLISGNTLEGVHFQGLQKLAVYGNFIGTDVTGTDAVPNAGGVAIHEGPATDIGSPTLGGGNLISGNNGNGVTISGPSNTKILVRANRIGTQANGTSPLPNTGHGILLANEAFGNTIGTVPATGWNIIAFNRSDGIALGPSAGVDNYIDPNVIHSNDGLGIDLGDDGITPNDANDIDGGSDGQTAAGPNTLQNYPIITRAEVVSGVLEVEGTLNSYPGNFYPLFFFASSECDASGYGEGERLVGEDFAGGPGPNYEFADSLSAPVYDGEFITATASNPESTSEFSLCFPVENAPPATPTPSPSPTASGTPTPTATATPVLSPTSTVDPTGSGPPTATSTPTPFGQTPSPTLEATPTPTPTSTPAGAQREWGDSDCTGGTNPVDSLKTLRVDAGLEVIQPSGCPDFGDHVMIDGEMHEWGDVDCSHSLNPIDSLKILRFDAGLGVDQPLDCPALGETVLVT